MERIGSTALIRRFGWVMDHVNAPVPAEIRDILLRRAARGSRTWMGPNPSRPVTAAIGYDKTWRLLINVSPDDLRETAGAGRLQPLSKGS
jgi:predicted transcriptional regulator of viral defense system